MIRLFLLFGLMGFIVACEAPEELKVMTFNIRYANPNDGDDYWEKRKEQVVDLIDLVGADFVGFQEVLPEQYAFLTEQLDQYSWIYRSREVNPGKGEAVPLAYNHNNWDCIWSETFWLSDTPEIPGSNTWEAACNRVTSWGLFCHIRSADTLLVCNTHFDHISQKARKNSALLILEKLAASGLDYPFILLGDLNGGPANEAVQILLERLDDPFPLFHEDQSQAGTYNGFKGLRDGKRIDYILSNGLIDAISIEIRHDEEAGRYPSDHFPVVATYSLGH
jgi:endonuclease/exonuclease/phosphatase family metal-dependent hydrolase